MGKNRKAEVGRPVNFDRFCCVGDFGRPEAGFLFPFAIPRNRFDIEAEGAQGSQVPITGLGHFPGHFMKNVEVSRKSRRGGGSVEDHTARKMALLGAVRREDG